MTRIVINNKYGGFSVSHQAFLELRARGVQEALDEPDYGEFYSDGSGPREQHIVERSRGGNFLTRMRRDHPALLALIDERGSEWVSGAFSTLVIIEIPDGVEWQVDEYDGLEHVAEKHRRWYAS